MLTSELYLDMLGHSIHHPELIMLMQYLKLGVAHEPDLIGTVTMTNKKNRIYFVFTIKRMYKSDYGNPRSVYADNDRELILQEVTFNDDDSKNRKPSGIPVPYNLQIADSVDTIIQKLGKKPYEKSTDKYDYKIEYAYRFYKDEYRILVKLDDKLKLIWFRIWLMELAEKNKIELKKSLSKQNKNITTANAQLLIQQKEKAPVNQWKERMLAGDELFTDKNIAAATKIIEQFIDQLSEAVQQKKAVKFM